MAGESTQAGIGAKFKLIAKMLMRLMDPKTGLLYEGVNRGANAIWPNSGIVDKFLPEGQAFSGQEGMMNRLIDMFQRWEDPNVSDLGTTVVNPGFTGTTGLPGGFEALLGGGLSPLSGQSTEGGANFSDGLLEALTGQMSTQDNASMMAASGLPTDVLKLSSPNQSTQPQASVNDLLVAMGLQNPDGSFVGGQSSAGPGADIGIAGGSMLDFLQGGGGGMTNPFGYGGGGYEDSMLASRMGRGSPRMGRGREFGDSGKEQSFLHR